MPKNFLIFFTTAFLIFTLGVQNISAYDATPPLLTWEPLGPLTCDNCGWCPPVDTNPDKPPDWQSCNNCLYPSGIPAPDHYYTFIGCMSTQPGEFTKSVLQLVFNIVGGIAFISILVGSFKVLTSGGNPEKLKSGKNIITSSIIGLLLVLFSAFILRLIGYDILKIPGFG
ncbi:hypothetical protein A2Y99_00240 [Candidatus Gottesmanbacteria bacterium RBG_13_37_7]|uniref:Uncharacterized protein n=1 Tax=Candidatus Gottesmanbacteria bacterium RBG_13_37_7 TaxID=1798369 RepID=A0A1F5YH29_9BACT|nr:MAG: hypothetical protein A2Y99_00240 [Candidatus Gottesmanbacteria bacterium RBG_13_37_7]